MATPAMPPGATSPMAYASWGKRFLAALIDWILLGIVNKMLTVVLAVIAGPIFGGLVGAGIGLVIGIGYFAYFESSQKQATIGKIALTIMVSDENGNRITPAKAVVRYLGKFLSTLILCIGWLMPLFTAKKQALHDMIAGTLVVEGKR